MLDAGTIERLTIKFTGRLNRSEAMPREAGFEPEARMQNLTLPLTPHGSPSMGITVATFSVSWGLIAVWPVAWRYGLLA